MENIDSLRQMFPGLETALLLEFEQYGRTFHVPEGEMIMDVGLPIKDIPVVTGGMVKVFRDDNEDHELLLYYLEPGEACASSLICAAGARKSKIRAVAMEPSTILALPIDKMDEWVKKYPSWYKFVLQAYQDKFEELLYTVDSIAFSHMDVRLDRHLQQLAHAKNSHLLDITHQQLAQELGTRREVVSRLLKVMENDGKLKLGRNQVEWFGT